MVRGSSSLVVRSRRKTENDDVEASTTIKKEQQPSRSSRRSDKKRWGWISSIRRTKKIKPLVVIFVSVLGVVLFFFAIAIVLPFMESIQDAVVEKWPSVLLRGESSTTWACQPTNQGYDHERMPIIVLSEQRSGSSLFFDLLRVLFHDSQQKKQAARPELLPFYELFLPQEPNEAKVMIWLAHLLDQACPDFELDDAVLGDNGKLQRLHTKEALYNSFEVNRPQGWDDIARPILKSFVDRMHHPASLLVRIAGIPSKSGSSYFAFKIFSEQLHDHLRMSPYHFLFQTDWTMRHHHNNVDATHSHSEDSRDIKYMVVWRRRIIESFVSLEIANHKRGGYANVKTTADDAIRINVKQLESFVHAKRQYYSETKMALERLGVKYQVFEYHRDLLTPQKQVMTVRRLGQALGILTVESDDEIGKMIQEASWVRSKQASVPLQDVVENWDEVVQAGFGGPVADWEDLFPLNPPK